MIILRMSHRCAFCRSARWCSCQAHGLCSRRRSVVSKCCSSSMNLSMAFCFPRTGTGKVGLCARRLGTPKARSSSGPLLLLQGQLQSLHIHSLSHQVLCPVPWKSPGWSCQGVCLKAPGSDSCSYLPASLELSHNSYLLRPSLRL